MGHVAFDGPGGFHVLGGFFPPPMTADNTEQRAPLDH